MVATVQPLATDAGVATIKNGGNAVDAAVAAALTLGVVDCHNSGIGGGCFIVLRTAEGRLVAIDGRETAPQAATRDMYLRDGEPQSELSKTGALASGTPGALAALDYAARNFGRRELADLILPAAEIAGNGFPIDRVFAARLSATAKQLKKFEASATIFLKPNGKPLKHGDILKQPDLAATYRAIGQHGKDWFYRGPFAEKTAQWMAANGGVLSDEDFKNYRVREREPVVSSYRDYKIVGFPPPSSGGVHVAQILNILTNFDLAGAPHDEFVHIIAESMKRAFADRAYWLGDPDFARVPRGLIANEYAAELAVQIDREKATEVAGHGKPSHWQEDVFGRHTTHIAAADAQGNWIGITTTINTSFGSKVVIPGTGVLLNNQMDDFSVAPGVPNAFGLVGAKANEIAPGKRPLSSMSPTIVLRNGQPVLTLGAAGGPRIISQVVLTIVNHVDRGMPLADSVAAARFHHQWSPDRLFVGQELDRDLVETLQERGHATAVMPYSGVTQAIGRGEDGVFVGVHDPRVPGKAAGP